ncbi:MAG: hypothetical protein CM1200mP10_32420 [Candidatus Neomarinimicrobiota bacterium]|nr:MAG: hypothetical protein CM1200mP10_32420 [Candidatus Neomarinimicrobiota bacterium]
MKMINDDKVIARPIVLYITNIPIIGLPFGIFPIRQGNDNQAGSCLVMVKAVIADNFWMALVIIGHQMNSGIQN